MTSAVEFATNTRVHIALDSSNIDRSVDFYSRLFQQKPTKMRTDYAKFEVADPPLNLALNARADAKPIAAHFGVQVKATEAVMNMKESLDQAGYETLVEDDVTCCYAVQDKVWIKDPDGNPWEVFVVTNPDSATHGKSLPGECCSAEATGSQASGCCA